MKGFLLENGDIVVTKKGEIQMTSGRDLVRQTVEAVIGTNNGEWFLNKDEGINFRAILGKSPNMDEVRSEVQKGLLQVDSSLFMQSFEYDVELRTLNVRFTASNGSIAIEGGTNYVR
jgi:hypothetical protein